MNKQEKIHMLKERLELVSNKKVILKEVNEGKYKFGCAMLYFDFPELKDFQKKISTDDIYNKPGFGLEIEPHLTLLYGFHYKETNSEEVFKEILKTKLPQLLLHNVSSFNNKDFDVLKFDCKQQVGKGIYSKERDPLFEINKDLISNFSYTSDFPDYHPHSTIAYLNSGTAKKYIEMFKEEFFTVNPYKIVYSEPIDNGNKTKKFEHILSKEEKLPKTIIK